MSGDKMSREDVALLARGITELEAAGVPVGVGAVLATCRALCEAYRALDVECAEAKDLATMRFGLIARYAKENCRLAGQNLAMASTLERLSKLRRSA